MPFDARAAKLLEPGQHFTITDCPGLRLEATATTRSWVYRFKSPVDGRMKQLKIGAWPKMSANAAIVEWERLRDARADGRDPAEERRTVRLEEKAAQEAARTKAARRLTVRGLCDLYLEGHVDLHRKPKGAAEARRMFDTMLGDFGDVDPAKVTRTMAFDFLQGFMAIPVQAGKLRGELGAAWDYGHDAGRLDDEVPNWWRLIMRGRLRSKGRIREGIAIGTAKRVLAPAEIGELIRWLPNFSRTVQDALTLYLWTGARGGEIVAMAAEEITSEADGLWWTLPKEKTKNAWREFATDLRVPLVGRAEEVVRRRLGVTPSGYLFPSRGKVGYVEQKTIGVAVWTHQPYSETRPEQVRPRLPVTHWAPHDLRRTVRTQLAALGCQDEIAEAVLGHMPAGVRGVYNLHRYDRERREWLARLDAHLEQLARG